MINGSLQNVTMGFRDSSFHFWVMIPCCDGIHL